MSSFLDRLNLRPQERRILVVILTVVLVLLNAVFVWPHFKDWRRVEKEIQTARETLATHRHEVDRLREYEAKLKQLEDAGSAVVPEAQALQLQSTVQTLAVQKNVVITSLSPASSTTSTNAFFDEQAVRVKVSTGDKELVDYLLTLGSGNSMIRVREMELKTDPPQYKLEGFITLAASYQKQNKPKPAPPKPAAKPAAKPATTTVKPPSTKP